MFFCTVYPSIVTLNYSKSTFEVKLNQSTQAKLPNAAERFVPRKVSPVAAMYRDNSESPESE